MSIVIFARGHGSGSVDRQCNNSDVSSGAITGSSPSFGRYCMAAAALPLLRCVWILAASCADWMRGPCWWTMALRYLHARMAALRVLGPSSAWFLAAVARISRASSSGDRGGSVLAVLCVGSFYQRFSLCEWSIKYDGNEHLSSIFLMRAGLPACICSRIALLCLTKVSFPLLYSSLR